MSKNNNFTRFDYWGILFFLVLAATLFFSTNYQRDWSLAADQEFTLAYNAALINSGYEQSYIDHPGFITVHVLAILLKVSHLIFPSIPPTIDALNTSLPLFQSYSFLVIVARAFAMFCAAIYVCLIYLACSITTGNRILSALTSLAFFMSDSLLIHLSQLRTEMIAFLLLISSIYFFYLAAQRKNSFSYIYLLLAFISFFLAALNKAQALLYVPLFLIWLLQIMPTQNKMIRVPFENKWDIFFSSLSLSAILIFTFSKSSGGGLSTTFNITYVLALNILVVLNWLKNSGNLSRLIIALNTCYLTAYFIVLEITKSASEDFTVFFKQINNPMEMLVWTQVRTSIGTSLGPEKLLGSVFSPDHTYIPIVKSIWNLNSQGILFFAGLLIYVLIKKRLSRSDHITFIIGIACYFLITIISSYRYLAPQYVIFSEFFLLFNLIFIISKINKEFVANLIISGIVVFLAMVNLPKLLADLNDNSNLLAKLCSDDYMKTYHSKLNFDDFKNACASVVGK